ncbi:uncharacterized protein LOC130722418 [Lotus japonicus]|uniref:uncharacterized protein LOC130722418 n=1 Tax=Lotus japonicus TaxID=34305 RepID=UPI00258F4CB7|nr:uncharacterized protein LOC130722418 [Lotus japonicus]
MRERGSDGLPSRWWPQSRQWPQSRRWPAQGHVWRANRWLRTEIQSNGYEPNNRVRHQSSWNTQRQNWLPRWKQEHQTSQREWRPWLGSDREDQHYQRSIPADSVKKNSQRKTVSRVGQDVKTQGQSFSVYVDGLSDRITLIKLKTIFGKAGRVKDVFIQFKRKFQRRFRYGFVRFQNDEEAWRAIRTLNGLRIDGNYLVVKRANPKQATTNSVPRKIWRPKKEQKQAIPIIKKETLKEEVSIREAPRQPDVGQLRFLPSDMDTIWYQRCARARTLEAKPVDVIQDELARIGMYNFRLIPLGAEELLLEFESKEEMTETLEECSFFLEQKLTDLHPCTSLTFGVAHLVWIRLWQVPLGLWSDSFFTAIGNRLGKFVEVDVATKQRHRADFARILVRMHHPLLHCFSMSVDMEGTTCVILVEKDVYAYDYGKMETMPSTPVKLYNSEDATDFGDYSENDNDIFSQEVHEPVLRLDEKFDAVADVDSGEEDKVFRNDTMEGLQNRVDVEGIYPGTNSVLHSGDCGDCEAQLQDTHAAAAAALVCPSLHQEGVQQKNSNFTALNGAFNAGKEVLEQ